MTEIRGILILVLAFLEFTYSKVPRGVISKEQIMEQCKSRYPKRAKEFTSAEIFMFRETENHAVCTGKCLLVNHRAGPSVFVLFNESTPCPGGKECTRDELKAKYPERGYSTVCKPKLYGGLKDEESINACRDFFSASKETFVTGYHDLKDPCAYRCFFFGEPNPRIMYKKENTSCPENKVCKGTGQTNDKAPIRICRFDVASGLPAKDERSNETARALCKYAHPNLTDIIDTKGVLGTSETNRCKITCATIAKEKIPEKTAYFTGGTGCDKNKICKAYKKLLAPSGDYGHGSLSHCQKYANMNYTS